MRSFASLLIRKVDFSFFLLLVFGFGIRAISASQKRCLEIFLPFLFYGTIEGKDKEKSGKGERIRE